MQSLVPQLSPVIEVHKSNLTKSNKKKMKRCKSDNFKLGGYREGGVVRCFHVSRQNTHRLAVLRGQ